MRRVLLVAAVALAVTFSGSVFANQITVNSQEVSLNLENKSVDSKTASLVLQYMANELGYDLEAISAQYAAGDLTIDQVDSNFVVSIGQDDGILVSIEEIF